ncbi:MAG TPA: hypothetical protein VJK04_00380 [Candidatus Paceibacterota bacterium]
MAPTEKTAFDVIRQILRSNAMLSSLRFGFYKPSLVHFKERKTGQHRDQFEATEHSKADGHFDLSREEIFQDGKLEEIIELLLPGQALQVFSLTHTGQIKRRVHIPMIDFEIEPFEENLGFALNSVKALRQAYGALLVSGGSYHYYGYKLMTQMEWEAFMYRALLLDDVVDRRWIGHRLLDGFSNLRISPKQGKYDYIPYVVSEF